MTQMRVDEFVADPEEGLRMSGDFRKAMWVSLAEYLL